MLQHPLRRKRRMKLSKITAVVNNSVFKSIVFIFTIVLATVHNNF